MQNSSISPPPQSIATVKQHHCCVDVIFQIQNTNTFDVENVVEHKRKLNAEGEEEKGVLFRQLKNCCRI